ncbi:MAG: hypothetical protein R3D63_00565 [Paracoccaceae bacterium]
MHGRVFQDLGDRLTRSLIAGDFALYAQVMALPLRIDPRGGHAYVLETPEALQRDFDLYHAAIRAAQVTDIFREVQEVDEQPDGGWRVFCRVHIFVHAHRIAEPHCSEMLLVPDPPGMRIAEIVATSEHIDWTLGRARLGPGDGLI